MGRLLVPCWWSHLKGPFEWLPYGGGALMVPF